MLGRGHLSILRQGHGSWPDRENFANTPVTGREDMVLMDGQLERDGALEFCPKNRPRKHFSPSKRPWDLCKAPQPKRLWDFSPPFCKERLQVNTRSIRRSQEPREHCCSSFDGACSIRGVPNHPRCTMRPAENGENAARRPPSSVPRSHVDQANVKEGFWLRQNEALPVETAAKLAPNEDHYLPSSFDHQVNSFTKAVTEQESKALQLCGEVETLQLQEIENLKAQMALLCERLAWHVSRCSKRSCKPGEVNSFGSEATLLLKGLGELKKVINVPIGSSESQREQGKDFEAEFPDGQDMQEICRWRNLAWKSGINTLLQALLWCFGFMITIVRCNSVPPQLLPT